MTSLNNIFGKPKFIQGVGNIHPIKLIDYDEFLDCSYIICYSKKHFGIEDENISLLRVLFQYGFNEPNVLINLQKAFSMVLKRDVTIEINENFFGFKIDEQNAITEDNYDLVRETIMDQNLMYEPKVFRNPLVKQWAEKVIAARAKNAIKMTLEDMITTVHVFTGVGYDELAEYTYYQLQADFNRIKKIKDYELSIERKIAGDDKAKIEHYAEELDLHKNPYDDLFVSKDKLSNLNKALGNQEG